jgi:PAS domain S-box-containing protein
LRVLIVDDDEFVRRGVRTLLSLATDDVSICGEAADGKEAIAKTVEVKPDVVLMDVRMPGMNGLEATRDIRHLSPWTQIIVLSNYEIPQARQEALKAGAADYVAKSEIWTRLMPSLRKLATEGGANGDTPGLDAQGESSDKTRDLRAQLRESEERFRATFEQSAVGMAHITLDGRWLRANQKLCQILGYTQQEMRRLTLRDVVHLRDVAHDFAQARKLANGEIDRYSTEQRYIRKDGGIVPVRLTVNAVRNPNGKLKYCVRVVEEVSAVTQRTAHNLEIAKGYLALLTNRMSAALTRCSHDLRYLWVNENYAKWMNRPIERIVGRRILDVFGKEAFRTLRPRFEQVLKGEDVVYKEKVAYEGIGLRHISAVYAPTRDLAGKVEGWMALVEDNTVPKASEGLQSD